MLVNGRLDLYRQNQQQSPLNASISLEPSPIVTQHGTKVGAVCVAAEGKAKVRGDVVLEDLQTTHTPI